MKSNQQSLQKLKDKWYKKLKNVGFKDIEDYQGRLKSWSTSGQTRYSDRNHNSRIYREARAEYYRRASQALYDNEFSSKMDKTIWALHADGKTHREISEEIGLARNTVREHIYKMRTKFSHKQ